MTNTDDKLAEALRRIHNLCGGDAWEYRKIALEALAAHEAAAQEPAGEAVPVAWRVWRGDSYELFFNEDAAKRRCECFVRKGKPEPLYTHPRAAPAAEPAAGRCRSE